jgi:hypothetical protein
MYKASPLYRIRNKEVRDRFLRFYKATTIFEHDAVFWAEKINTLMLKSKKSKREKYKKTSHKYQWVKKHHLTNRFGHFWAFGIEYYHVEKEKIVVIKSIYRHINKLTEINNLTERKDKWQQLIRQVI